MVHASKWFRSVRWRFFGAVIAAAALTVFTLFLGYAVADWMLDEPGWNRPWRWLVNNVGSSMVMTVTGVLLFPVYYWLASRRPVQEMQQLAGAVERLSAGHFDIRLPARSRDEIGAIAEALRRYADGLDKRLDELTAGLREIGEGRFDREIPVRGEGRLDEVAESINRMSRELHRSIEEERRAECTKNELITGVSHDLRTPLTSILGFLEVIEQDRYRDEVELRQYISIVYEKSLALRKLVDDLFEYTRISSGLPLSRGRMDLAAFLRQLADEFAPDFENAAMVCRLNLPEGAADISADGALLARAFGNLLNNAVRYGNAGGYVEIGLRREGREWVIAVTNSGDPIPQEDLPYIFERFYRVERSRSKDTGGTGLGLAIVKSIIEAHGGTITARSGRYETTFEARLPAGEAEAGKTAEIEEAAMVADDAEVAGTAGVAGASGVAKTEGDSGPADAAEIIGRVKNPIRSQPAGR